MSQCTANRTNGQPCKGQAISGATVCRVHGGSAPQVIEAARRRLLAMVPGALGVLQRSARVRRGKEVKNWEPSKEEIAAAREILDRAGLKAADKHELSGPDGGPIRSEHRLVFVDAPAAVDPVAKPE